MKALVAMSGGVDSSVAAALMLEQGHEVVGVTLKQWVGVDGRLPTAGCCTVADAEDARRVAAQLGIAHYVLDHVEEFTEAVVDRFVEGYRSGITPNPCVECNRRVRFGTLLERVDALGCDFLVTGHHARVAVDGGRARLLTARDAAKDQSYVLHALRSDQLAHIRFPVGELTKDEVRAEATRLGLRTAAKPDSQDLCFVDGDYRSFLRERAPDVARSGTIVDESGAVVGEHQGVVDFTVGQRRGLGVAVGEPRYVVSVEPATSVVTIGPRRALARSGCRLSDVGFVGDAPSGDTRIEVKVRYRSAAVPATVRRDDSGWTVEFDEPQYAVAPGQAAVFYDGDEVLGGGTIAEVSAA